MDQTKELLTRQIDTEIQSLSTMEAGSEEKTATIDGLTKLYKLKIEETKNEKDLEAQKAERDILKKDKIVGRVLDGLGIGLPLVFSAIWMKKGFKFEETGTFTSQTFRSLWGKFKPFK